MSVNMWFAVFSYLLGCAYIYSGNERVKINENKAGQLLRWMIYLYFMANRVYHCTANKTFNFFLTHMSRKGTTNKSIVRSIVGAFWELFRTACVWYEYKCMAIKALRCLCITPKTWKSSLCSLALRSVRLSVVYRWQFYVVIQTLIKVVFVSSCLIHCRRHSTHPQHIGSHSQRIYIQNIFQPSQYNMTT